MAPASGEERAYSILLTDDHPIFRQGLSRIVRRIPGVQHIGEASNGVDLLTMLTQQKWDLVLLDIEMPKMGGIQAMAKITRLEDPPKVIILSMHSNIDYVRQLYAMGIKGYMLKESSAGELEEAIRTVLKGDVFFAGEVKDILFQDFVKKDKLTAVKAELTERELDVLTLICEEKTGPEIAAQLHLSEETIGRYRKILLDKTGSKNMAGLVLYAVKHGLYRI